MFFNPTTIQPVSRLCHPINLAQSRSYFQSVKIILHRNTNPLIYGTSDMTSPHGILKEHLAIVLVKKVYTWLDIHQWGWYSSTNVYHPKLHQWGTRENQLWHLVKEQLVWPWHSHFLFIDEFVSNTFGVGNDGFGLLLLTWEMSSNPVHLFSFFMVWASHPVQINTLIQFH